MTEVSKQVLNKVEVELEFVSPPDSVIRLRRAYRLLLEAADRDVRSVESKSTNRPGEKEGQGE